MKINLLKKRNKKGKIEMPKIEMFEPDTYEIALQSLELGMDLKQLRKVLNKSMPIKKSIWDKIKEHRRNIKRMDNYNRYKFGLRG